MSLSLLLAVAWAQDPAIDAQRFDPAPQAASFSVVRDADPSAIGVHGLQVGVNYAHNPFELTDPETGARTATVVENLVGIDLGAHVAPSRWVGIGVQLPVLQASFGYESTLRTDLSLGGSGRTLGFGDLTLSVPITPLRQGDNAQLSVAVVPRLVLPTGARRQFVGSGAVGIGADAVVSGRWDAAHVSASLGYQVNTRSQVVGNVYADDELRWGLGLGAAFPGRTWEIQAEWFGGAVVDRRGRDLLGDAWAPQAHAPQELLLGVLHTPREQPIWVKVGGGPGLSRGFGAPDVRVFAQLGWHASRKVVPTPVVDAGDRDRDGFPDASDLCPDVPEDVGDLDPLDGCPEGDDDRDGIADRDDRCRLYPEDRDGWQDADGCPDPDNDLDGVPDDRDGHRTASGRVVMAGGSVLLGDCANAAETHNGVDDLDGCPDQALARLVDREIVLYDRIYFDTNRATLRPESAAVLQAVADVLREHPEIDLLEIQGHADARGGEAANVLLSDARAWAVRDWLTRHGVSADRLFARGYGESRPAALGGSGVELQANRRVQFLVLRVDGQSVRGGSAPAPGSR